MSNDPQGSDEKDKPKEYLKRVDYGYIFHLTGGLYKPQPDQSENEVGKNASHDEKQIPIFVTVKTSNNWVSNLIALAAVLVSILTVFLLVATVYVAKKQWREINVQTQNSTEALVETKSANKSNANDSQRAYELSRQALESVQRAFVVPGPQMIVIPEAPNSTNSVGIQITPMWTNWGSTPTRNFTMHGSRQVFTTLPANFDYPDLWDPGTTPHKATPAVIPPKGSVGGPQLKISAAEQRTVADGNAGYHYYMWGWAKYHDVFPGTTEHVSKYCWKILITRVSGEPGKPEGFATTSENCPSHNCTDEECRTQ